MVDEIKKIIILNMKQEGKTNSEIMKALNIKYPELRKILDGEER